MEETTVTNDQATLRFCAGTLELTGISSAIAKSIPDLRWDDRARCYRSPACHYARVVTTLHRLGIHPLDEARRYATLKEGLRIRQMPRPYQAEALAAWKQAKHRGLVVLPTGAGKTWVAFLAIDDRRRSTLVIAPTLDLVHQWHDGLATNFGIQVGIVGGGDYDVRDITVTTYDSAYLHMEHFGNRFGLVVFDECHHLPSESYALAAQLCLAPFRLGLTATPEREDGREHRLNQIVGPIVFRKDIVDLAGEYLSAYETVRITVELSAEERAEYVDARTVFHEFLHNQGISMASPQGFSDFIIRASRTQEGRRAFAAYRRQREIAFTAPAKLDYVERLLEEHRHDRTILFTQDNATVYQLSRRFLIPAITHRTKVSERSHILAGFTGERYSAIATSRVLNEGVDMPEANIAIVLSGSGSVREHVQRLGRILRKRSGKRAILYELVTGGTSETRISSKRRDHIAYR